MIVIIMIHTLHLCSKSALDCRPNGRWAVKFRQTLLNVSVSKPLVGNIDQTIIAWPSTGQRQQQLIRNWNGNCSWTKMVEFRAKLSKWMGSR